MEVSRQHAAITCVNGIWQCRDIGSVNGTLVNGVRLNNAPVPLASGYVIVCGSQSFRFEVLTHNSDIRRSFDPGQAFDCRRAIVLSLQAAQRSEHQLLESTAIMCRAHKAEILKLLSRWLLAQNISNASTLERREMETLSGMSLREWDTQQSASLSIEARLNEAVRSADQANDRLTGKAPLGMITEVFATGGDKVEIRRLKKEHGLAKRKRDRTEAELQDNIESRQIIAEEFFRCCLRNIEKLSSSRALGREVSAIIVCLAHDMKQALARHATEQHDVISKAIDQLLILQGSFVIK
jgi:pSer/pThr/pTyr-binding forkhead associated (FHA) protein